MTYLLGDEWRSFFDAVIVDARKPMWFGDGTVFREVNTDTGALKIGMHTGSIQKGNVYSGVLRELNVFFNADLSGGSCEVFTRMMRARGKDVLYVGDHIFGDVLRSKKSRGWRTMLIIPELEVRCLPLLRSKQTRHLQRELRVWTEQAQLFEQLQALDVMMGETYK